MLENAKEWTRTLLFAAGVAVVCGTLVSVVSVWLEPRQAQNAQRDREAVLQSLLACQPELVEFLEDAAGAGLAGLDARLVDLDTGCYAPHADALCFDVEAAAADPRQQLTLPPQQDVASIGVRPNQVVVYEVRRDDELALLVLPVYGQGYASRLDGFLSLEADLDTVSSLVFYAHGETPGMGARIGETDWQAAWRGKRTRDETGHLRIGVRVRPSGEESPYEIDAMTGATRTGVGVTNLLRFWLGDLGYAPLIRNLESSAPCVREAV